MKASEILNEKPVESAWITDLVYNRPNKRLTMRVSNGKTYSISGISRSTFERWTNAISKGQFYHEQIRNKYKVNRIS